MFNQILAPKTGAKPSSTTARRPIWQSRFLWTLPTAH